MDLFGRQIVARAGFAGELGREWEGLRMRFDVHATPSREPNTLNLEIFNLSKNSRSWIREGMKVEIEAGYQETITQIFKGEIRHFGHERHGPEWVTKIEAADGVEANTATIEASIKPGASPADIIGKLKGAMTGGNISDGFADLGALARDIPEKLRSTVLSGNAGDELSALLEPNGYQWSTQGERIQITKIGGSTDEPAIVVDGDSGLVGSPVRREGGGVEVVALLNGRIRPGRAIKVKSSDIEGFYVVQSARHTGDTHGGGWNTIAEGVEL